MIAKNAFILTDSSSKECPTPEVFKEVITVGVGDENGTVSCSRAVSRVPETFYGTIRKVLGVIHEKLKFSIFDDIGCDSGLHYKLSVL